MRAFRVTDAIDDHLLALLPDPDRRARERVWQRAARDPGPAGDAARAAPEHGLWPLRAALRTPPPKALARVVVHARQVNALLALPGGRLLSAGEDGRLVELGIDPLVQLRVVSDAQPINALAGVDTPEGFLVATAGDDRTATLLDGASLRARAVCEGHPQYVRCVDVDARFVATGCDDGSVRLFHHDGTLVFEVDAHGGGVMAVALAGESLLSCGLDNAIRCWTLEGEGRAPFYESDSGDALMLSGSLYVAMDNTSGRGHRKPPHHLRPFGEGWLSADRELIVWSCAGEERSRRVLAWAPEALRVRGGRIAVTSTHGTGMLDAELQRTSAIAGGSGERHTAVAWVTDDELALGTTKGAIEHHALADHPVDEHHVGFVWQAQIGGTLGATCDQEGAFKVWCMKTGAHLRTFDAFPESGSRPFALHPAGELLVTGHQDRPFGEPRVFAWDPRTGRRLTSFARGDEAHMSPGGFAFLPGGNVLVLSISADLFEWNPRTGETWKYEGRTKHITGVGIDGASLWATAYFPIEASDGPGSAPAREHLQIFDLQTRTLRLSIAAEEGSSPYRAGRFGTPHAFAGRAVTRDGTENGGYVLRDLTGATIAELGEDWVITSRPRGDALMLVRQAERDAPIYLERVDARGGRTRVWDAPWPLRGPALTDERFLAHVAVDGDPDTSDLVELDLATGEERWRARLDGGVGAIALSGDRALVTTRAGRVLVLGPGAAAV